MSVDFIGFIGFRNFSETIPPEGPDLDPAYVEAVARAHDEAGFDRALIAFGSTSPESMLCAQYAAAFTKRLAFMVAHRPGFTAQTVAARQFATLDQLTGGRAGVHIITGGGSEASLNQDGSYLGKEERYARTDEYIEVMRKEWMSEKPFDYHGKYYDVDGAFSVVKCVQKPHIPIYFGGSSDAALDVGGKHADVYALFGETTAMVRETVTKVSAAAAKYKRSVRFNLSVRPILAETEEAAWAKAQGILDRAKEVANKTGFVGTKTPENVGASRLLAAAAQGARLDKRLWTEMTALTKSTGNSTALVGTPEQVAEALLDYYDLGVTSFLIRGYDPIEDAKQYGRELIPLVRDMVEKRKSAGLAAE